MEGFLQEDSLPLDILHKLMALQADGEEAYHRRLRALLCSNASVSEVTKRLPIPPPIPPRRLSGPPFPHEPLELLASSSTNIAPFGLRAFPAMLPAISGSTAVSACPDVRPTEPISPASGLSETLPSSPAVFASSTTHYGPTTPFSPALSTSPLVPISRPAMHLSSNIHLTPEVSTSPTVHFSPATNLCPPMHNSSVAHTGRATPNSQAVPPSLTVPVKCAYQSTCEPSNLLTTTELPASPFTSLGTNEDLHRLFSLAIDQQHHLRQVKLPTFSGYGDHTSPENFLLDIEQYARSQSMTLSTMLSKVIPAALLGDAFRWWTFVGGFASWTDFKTALHLEYDQPDYYVRLQAELDSRTQHPEEPLTAYIRTIASYYDRLGSQATEVEKVDRIMRQMHPQFYLFLQGQRFNSLQELAAAAPAIQASIWRMLRYQPPPSPAASVAPDLAFGSPIYVGSHAQVQSDMSKGDNACWSCGLYGHFKRNCPKSIHTTRHQQENRRE